MHTKSRASVSLPSPRFPDPKAPPSAASPPTTHLHKSSSNFTPHQAQLGHERDPGNKRHKPRPKPSLLLAKTRSHSTTSPSPRNLDGHAGSSSATFRSFSTETTNVLGTPLTSTLHRRSGSLALDVRPTPPSSAPPRSPLPSIMAEKLAEPPPVSRASAFYQRNKGLAYVLAAQVFGTLMNVTTRLLEIEGNQGTGMHPFQILFVRMAITTILSTAYMWWTSIPHFPFGIPEVRWLLSIRGIGGFFGVFGMYYSLLYLPLADATVLTFITPSLSCWACSFLLNEPFTRLEQLGALISFIGVTFIARPTTFYSQILQVANEARDETPMVPPATLPEDPGTVRLGVADLNRVSGSQRFGAVCVALTGVLGSAMAFTAMRWIGKRAHPLLSVNYFCALTTVVSGTGMIILPGVEFLLPTDTKEWSYLVFLGVCGFAMQFLLSAGLQHEKSSRATNMVYTQMVFALIFDKLVFGTNPALLSVLGSTMILGSVIYVAMEKAHMKQRQDAEQARQEEARAGREEMEMSGARGLCLARPRRASRDEEEGPVDGVDKPNENEK